MTKSVLVLGGYGNFGKRIAYLLTQKNIPVIIAGRNKEKAEAFAATLPSSLVSVSIFDVHKALPQQLQALQPSVVINTCGPFQTNNYDVAEVCIKHGVHYVDLADGRAFVNGIAQLDEKARQNNVVVISGASTVPGLSSAVVEHYHDEFSIIESLQYGISPGQKTERGLATTQAVMSYVGKTIQPFASRSGGVYGWQNIYRQAYPSLGKRWMANCDIPDLDLLPVRYGIRCIQFSAGMELSLMHLGIWLLSWLVRIGVPLDLSKHASTLLRVSQWFDWMGTANGGMHMVMRGKNKAGEPHERRWFIIAKDGDGPNIPCVPAVILAKQLVLGVPLNAGAYPCVGVIKLEDYMAELEKFNIHQVVY